MKDIVIIEFPSNLGLKEPQPGKEPGVKRLPQWLQQHGFHDRLKPIRIEKLDPPAYSNKPDPLTGLLNMEGIVSYTLQQAEMIRRIIHNNEIAFVLGGDCSILTGNALGLKQAGRYGLFYLDGHTDFMRPDLSSTGGVAGLDLAIVTGYGPDTLTNLQGKKPYIQQTATWCVGNREYDPAYVGEILASDIKYIDLEKLRMLGMKNCADQFLKMVDQQRLDGFWLHIDADILNPSIMPAVDSPDPGGLDYEEWKALITPLLASNKLAGLEITILDPDLDPGGIYTKRFIDEFMAAWDVALKN